MQMGIHLAMETQRRYVCARCWGPLIVLPGEDRLMEVVCANPARCDGKGFVTRKYTERRRSDSIAELWEVRDNYPGWERVRKIQSSNSYPNSAIREVSRCP